MAAPLSLIQEGIETANWQKVCDGYEAMTGNHLDPTLSTTNDEVTMFVAIETIHRICKDFLVKIKPEKQDVVMPIIPKEIKSGVKLLKKVAKPPKKKVAERPLKAEKLEKPSKSPLVEEASDNLVCTTVEEHNKFHIKHGEVKQDVREDGRKEAKKLPFKPGMTNEFVDTGELAVAEKDFDKKVGSKRKPPERRPQAAFVKVKCSRCDGTSEVSLSLAPRRLAGDDEETSYVCNSCISKAVIK